MNINEYQIGGEDRFGKKIKDILFHSDAVIVYINSDDVISWYRASCDDFHENFGEIQNKISEWESKINDLFSKKGYRLNRLLAEAYVRILHDRNIVQSRDIINRVIKTVEKRGRELLKQYYAISSFVTTVLISLLIWLSKYNKVNIEAIYGKEEYKIWMTMLFGGIGAFVFTIVRLRNYKADIEISKNVHILDGVLRIFYGIIFGLVIAIAIKSNLLLGFLNQIDKSVYVSVFLGICAGASEILIPSLIKQIETKTDQE